MKALLAFLALAAPARADLTLPLPSRDEPKARASAERTPFSPMEGTWSGPVRCADGARRLTLKFDDDDPKREGRAFIVYTVESSAEGFMATLTLAPTKGADGEYLSADGSARLPPLLFRARGRVVTAESAGGAMAARLEARMMFDGHWRSASVSFRRGTGASCAGSLKRGAAR